MRNRKMSNMMPLNLQFFAEGDGGSQSGDAGTGAGTGEGGAGEGAAGAAGAENGKSFEDVLKDPKMQSEFDKRVAKALETSRAKMETASESLRKASGKRRLHDCNQHEQSYEGEYRVLLQEHHNASNHHSWY